MELPGNNIQLFSLPDSTPKARDNDFMISEAGVKDYEPLLCKIATSFGFIDSEAMDLVKEVCSCFNVYGADLLNETLLRFRLSKVIVHKCIFKISSQLFSQHMEAETKRVTEMPLSLRAVFILQDIIGFNEIDIAEMLNTDLLQVKHRHNKALLFIKNNH